MSVTRFAAAVALATLSVAASAESRFNASLGGLRDGNDNESLDFDAAFAPVESLTLGAGTGKTESRSTAGDIDGTSLRAFADLHSQRFGLRGYYRNWNSSGFDTDTVGGRASVNSGGLTLSVIGEARGFDVDYSGGTVANPQRSTASFNGTGWGVGASFNRSGWATYAEGVYYHYSSLSQYVPAQTPIANTPGSPAPVLPVLPGVPLLPGSVIPGLPTLTQSFATLVPTLSGSFITLNQGALDHLLSAGVERAFERSSLRLDWAGAKDAVLGSDSNTFSAGYRYTFTQYLNAGLTVGITDSEFGSTNFGGVSFGINL